MTGIKNLNLMTKDKLILTFAIFFMAYLLPEIYFNNAMIYITGGIVGGTINDVLEMVYKNPSPTIILLVWLLILVCFIFLSLKVQNIFLKYFSVLMVSLLLYVVDTFVAFIPTIEIYGIPKAIYVNNILLILTILFKSILLCLIINYSFKNKLVSSKT